ncbi:MAG: helix-turn-helix transcriptional regulator [Pseudomonadota bacterium]
MDSAPPFGRLLKFWRGIRGLSQEELAHRLDSTARHISRLENGHVHPSKVMVEGITRVFALGERDSNNLLMAAGFNPHVTGVDFFSPRLRWLRKAMTLTLRALDPYPSILMDGASNILMVNRGWVGFYRSTITEDSLNAVSNHFDFLFSRKVPADMMDRWQDTLSVVLMSLSQGVLMSGSEEGQALLDRLLATPNVPQDWRQRGARLEPMASYRVQFEFQGRAHSFFSVSQTVGAMGPNAYVSAPHLTVNTLYPEDEALDLSPLIVGELKHPLLAY